jgi:hypothetical protein
MLNINIKAAAARAVFMVISRELRNSVDQLPRSMLDKRTQTNERVCRARTAARGSRAQWIPSFRCM